jgi:hypothetical protein
MQLPSCWIFLCVGLHNNLMLNSRTTQRTPTLPCSDKKFCASDQVSRQRSVPLVPASAHATTIKKVFSNARSNANTFFANVAGPLHPEGHLW